LSKQVAILRAKVEDYAIYCMAGTSRSTSSRRDPLDPTTGLPTAKPRLREHQMLTEDEAKKVMFGAWDRMLRAEAAKAVSESRPRGRHER